MHLKTEEPEGLAEAARASVVQHVDETGGKIGGRSAWLWVFADAHATLYRIRRSRGHEVVVEVRGEDYGGVLVSDCFLAAGRYGSVGGWRRCCAWPWR